MSDEKQLNPWNPIEANTLRPAYMCSVLLTYYTVILILIHELMLFVLSSKIARAGFKHRTQLCSESVFISKNRMTPGQVHETAMVSRNVWQHVWIVIFTPSGRFINHQKRRWQSMWAERERSGKRSGAGRKPTWAERSGERAKSAAQNQLHHKTTQSKISNRFKSYHETVNVNSLLLCLLCRE